MRANGAVIYDGPSQIDGAPIVAVATGLRNGSANTKTGPMVQVWYLPKDVDPYSAVHSGRDRSVCGNCPARGTVEPKAGGGRSCKGRYCYVNLARAPLSVWNSLHRGIYTPDTETALVALRNRVVRLGAYGDPVSAPFEVARRVVDGVSKWTGYTHMWRDCDPAFRRVLMASCDTPEDREEAKAGGWRTFRTKLPEENVLPGEIVCPASEEAGHRTICYACGICSGVEGRGTRDVTIDVHGTAKGAYLRWRVGDKG